MFLILKGIKMNDKSSKSNTFDILKYRGDDRNNPNLHQLAPNRTSFVSGCTGSISTSFDDGDDNRLSETAFLTKKNGLWLLSLFKKLVIDFEERNKIINEYTQNLTDSDKLKMLNEKIPGLLTVPDNSIVLDIKKDSKSSFTSDNTIKYTLIVRYNDLEFGKKTYESTYILTINNLQSDNVSCMLSVLCNPQLMKSYQLLFPVNDEALNSSESLERTLSLAFVFIRSIINTLLGIKYNFNFVKEYRDGVDEIDKDVNTSVSRNVNLSSLSFLFPLCLDLEKLERFRKKVDKLDPDKELFQDSDIPLLQAKRLLMLMVGSKYDWKEYTAGYVNSPFRAKNIRSSFNDNNPKHSFEEDDTPEVADRRVEKSASENKVTKVTVEYLSDSNIEENKKKLLSMMMSLPKMSFKVPQLKKAGSFLRRTITGNQYQRMKGYYSFMLDINFTIHGRYLSNNLGVKTIHDLVQKIKNDSSEAEVTMSTEQFVTKEFSYFLRECINLDYWLNLRSWTWILFSKSTNFEGKKFNELVESFDLSQKEMAFILMYIDEGLPYQEILFKIGFLSEEEDKLLYGYKVKKYIQMKDKNGDPIKINYKTEHKPIRTRELSKDKIKIQKEADIRVEALLSSLKKKTGVDVRFDLHYHRSTHLSMIKAISERKDLLRMHLDMYTGKNYKMREDDPLIKTHSKLLVLSDFLSSTLPFDIAKATVKTPTLNVFLEENLIDSVNDHHRKFLTEAIPALDRFIARRALRSKKFDWDNVPEIDNTTDEE